MPNANRHSSSPTSIFPPSPVTKMNLSADLQDRIARTLEAPGALPCAVPVVRWRKKDIQSDHEATLAAASGLCLYVPMPVPTSAMQGTPFVFFDGFECRVQIVEMPNINRDGAVDLYDLIEAVALALHWQPKAQDSPLAGILAHPLYLSARPVEMAEGLISVPGFEHDGQVIRAADVVFNAVLQLNPQTA
ncbi:MAG: hypothetical protein ABI615_01760 [Chthoniobacterales bacterium]